MTATAIVPPRGRLFRFRDACAYLGGMSERRLRHLVTTKRIPVHRDGLLGFWQRDLDEWIERHRTPAVDEPKSKHIDLPRVTTEPRGIDDLMPRKLRLSRVS